MSEDEEALMVDRVESMLQRSWSVDTLRRYRVLYLAFQLGADTEARDECTDAVEASRHQRELERHRSLLRNTLDLDDR